MDPTFGQRLKRWLAIKAMRPAELARAVGVKPPTMFEWMNDLCAPRGDRLPAIAAALGITQGELFGPLPDLPEGAKVGGEAA